MFSLQWAQPKPTATRPLWGCPLGWVPQAEDLLFVLTQAGVGRGLGSVRTPEYDSLTVQ